MEEVNSILQKAATEMYQKAAAEHQKKGNKEGKKDEKVVDAEVVDEEK